MTKEIDSIDHASKQPLNPIQDDEREYEESGLYPPGEKPFRLFRLLGSLLGVVVFIAIAAVVLDRILIQP